MKDIHDFKKRIKDMCKLKEKNEESKEKTYSYLDICVVEDTIDENIFVCIKKVLEDRSTEYTKTVGANNIEDESQVAEYRLHGLPAGRACFGGYTDKDYNKGKTIYSFSDVWYKIYGRPLQAGTEFTKRQLLEMLPEIEKKFKDTKFMYLYSIKCKDTYTIMKSGEPEFEIELMETIGKSRVYNRAKYTPEACKQIIRNHKRERTEETR